MTVQSNKLPSEKRLTIFFLFCNYGHKGEYLSDSRTLQIFRHGDTLPLPVTAQRNLFYNAFLTRLDGVHISVNSGITNKTECYSL